MHTKRVLYFYLLSKLMNYAAWVVVEQILEVMDLIPSHIIPMVKKMVPLTSWPGLDQNRTALISSLVFLSDDRVMDFIRNKAPRVINLICKNVFHNQP